MKMSKLDKGPGSRRSMCRGRERRHPAGIVASAAPRSSLPPPAFQISRKYLSRIPDRSAPDTSQIGSASVANPELIGER